MSAFDPTEYLLKLPVGTIKSTSTRMENAVDCRRLVWRCIEDDRLRSYYRAICKSCYDGSAPYSAKQLAENGGRWMANLNFMGLQAIMDQARIPYYALFSGVQNYCDFYTYEGDPNERQQWCDIVAEKWKAMVDTWKQFKWHMKASQFEMLFEGWGPIMWENEIDWRFRSIPARNVLVPQRTESCLDHRVPFCVVRTAYRVHELYDKISDPDIARQAGWDVQAVQWAIKYATKGQGDENWMAQPWERWEQRFKNHDICGSYTDWDIINCSHVFVQEYAVKGETPKVSHFIVLEGSSGESMPEEKVGFLYKHVNRYESYAETMVVCFQNTGDGTWHSVRGVGLKAFKHIEIENRLMCNQINNAILSGMMILEPASGQSSDKAQNIKFGNGVAWIPPNSKFVDARLGGDIQGPMAVQRMIVNNRNSNIGQYTGNSITREDGRGERATAAEVNYAEGKETSLTQGQIDSYYENLDMIYENMFRRAVKGPDAESREFIRQCIDAGVPKEVLEGMKICANKLSGYPSPEARKKSVAALWQIVPSLPEDGKNAALNLYISTFGGPDKVQVLNPPQKEPDMQQWAATIENDSLVDGMMPPIVSGMNDVVHLKVHLGYADERLSPYKEAIEAGEQIDESTLQTLMQYVSTLGPHCEEHIARLESDPLRAGLAKLFEQQMKNVVAFHGALRGAILDAQRMAQQQALEEQQATALGIMDQAKLASMQAEQQRKDAVAGQDQARKNWKAEQAQSLKTYQVSQQSKLAAVKTASDISLSAAKTASDVRNQSIKAKAAASKPKPKAK